MYVNGIVTGHIIIHSIHGVYRAQKTYRLYRTAVLVGINNPVNADFNVEGDSSCYFFSSSFVIVCISPSFLHNVNDLHTKHFLDLLCNWFFCVQISKVRIIPNRGSFCHVHDEVGNRNRSPINRTIITNIDGK